MTKEGGIVACGVLCVSMGLEVFSAPFEGYILFGYGFGRDDCNAWPC